MAILLYDLVGADAGRPFSPHCWKAKMALAHKGLEFDTVPTPFTSVPKVEGGTSKTVPVIRDGDKVVADSFAIALYLEDAYPAARPCSAAPAARRWRASSSAGRNSPCIRSRARPRCSTSTSGWMRPTKPISARTARCASARSLEDVTAGRDAGLAAYRASLEPLRSMLA